MKYEILKRTMFSSPSSKSAKNTGIMAGFEEGMQEEKSMEQMPPMARTPQNPEILMNTLRGDMRSVDARYMELAQMVGEQAAMDTPPEVLAMLQAQMAPPPEAPAPQGAPQPPAGGIGSLPQAEQMMLQGMEGAPPFPQGGAEQAPPTPDGLPPIRAFGGAFISAGRRALEYGKDYIPMLADDIGAAMKRVPGFMDELAGNYLPPGFRVTPDVRNGGRTVVQGRENIIPGITPSQASMGTGTRLQAGNTLDYGQVPLSRAFKEDPTLARMLNYAQENPNAAFGGATALGLGTIGASIGRGAPFRSDEELAKANALIDQIPGQGPPLRDAKGNLILPPAKPKASPEAAAILQVTPPVAAPAKEPQAKAEEKSTFSTLEAPEGNDYSKFLNRAFTTANKESSTMSRADRIKEEAKGLEPVFKEILGDTKADTRTNALLLLADAGFKFASTYKPTMAMALADAVSGIPKGFASIIAQARANNIKIKTAVLEQAVSNVNLQDKVAKEMQLKEMELQGNLYKEIFKAQSSQDLEKLKGRIKNREIMLQGDINILLEQVKSGGVVEEDGGMGLTIQKTKNGSYLGNYIKPDQAGNLPPVVKGAIDSRWTLRDTDNPFVEKLGAAPTTVETDKGERVKLGITLRALDNSLKTFDNLRGQYAQLYGPGAWFTDKVNNLLVPLSGGAISPNVDQVAAATQLRSGLNAVVKSIAAANDQGRVAVQEQEWARDITEALNNPTAFFSNKEIAAKQLSTMEAQLRNARQQVLTQLGYEKNDYVMKPAPTGTQNDPFVVPTTPEDQQRMFNFLGSTIGTLQDPRATVYLRLPNGRTDAFTPTQLKGLIKK